MLCIGTRSLYLRQVGGLVLEPGDNDRACSKSPILNADTVKVLPALPSGFCETESHAVQADLKLAI